MEMSKKPENKALSVPERAVLALGYNELTRQELAELAAKNAHIVEITNDDGRKQADRARLDLRAARIEIKRKGKLAREDATAYSKAVIAEEDRLVALVEPEEDRLAALVGAFDAKIEAEKQAKILAEQQRTERLTLAVETIRRFVDLPVNPDPQTVLDRIAVAESVVIGPAFEEFEQQASDAKGATLHYLRQQHEAAVERVAAAEQARKNAAELEALRAEKAARDKADAEKKAADEKAERERQAAAAACMKVDVTGTAVVPPLTFAAGETVKTPLSVSVYPPSLSPVILGVDLGAEMPGDVTYAPPPPRPPPTLAEIVALLMFQYDADEATVLNWLDAAVRGTRRAA
jgi:hypothetical protein